MSIKKRLKELDRSLIKNSEITKYTSVTHDERPFHEIFIGLIRYCDKVGARKSGEIDFMQLPALSIIQPSHIYNVLKRGASIKLDEEIKAGYMGIRDCKPGELSFVINISEVLLTVCCAIPFNEGLNQLLNEELRNMEFDNNLYEMVRKISPEFRVDLGVKLYTYIYTKLNRKIPVEDLVKVMTDSELSCEDVSFSMKGLHMEKGKVCKEIKKQNDLIDVYMAEMEEDSIDIDGTFLAQRVAYNSLENLFTKGVLDVSIDFVLKNYYDIEFALNHITQDPQYDMRISRGYLSQDSIESNMKYLEDMLRKIDNRQKNLGRKIGCGAELLNVSSPIFFKKTLLDTRAIDTELCMFSVTEDYLSGIFAMPATSVELNSIGTKIPRYIVNMIEDHLDDASCGKLFYFSTTVYKLLENHYKEKLINNKVLIDNLKLSIESEKELYNYKQLVDELSNKDMKIKELNKAVTQKTKQVNKISTELEKLSESVNETEIMDKLSDNFSVYIKEESDIEKELALSSTSLFIPSAVKVSKNLSDLNLVIVTDKDTTRNLDKIVPLFNKVIIRDIRDTIDDINMDNYDMVIVRTDRLPHGTMYNINKNTKKVLAVSKPNSINWLNKISKCLV